MLEQVDASEYSHRMAILNPIDGAAVAGMVAAMNPEGRLQSLLRLWYGSYFGGSAFNTRSVAGGQSALTFQQLDLLWQEDELPENPQRPSLHTILTPVTLAQDRTLATETTSTDGWQADLIVRVPVNLSGTPFKGQNPEHLARRVAGEVIWLFCSSEREALAQWGVHEIRLHSGPRILPGTAWHARQIAATMTTFRSQAV